MSRLRDRCPACSRRLITTRFDTTFRLSDRSERLCFGIPGGLCEDCSQLYIDPELIELLDLGDARCVFAIETERGTESFAVRGNVLVWQGEDGISYRLETALDEADAAALAESFR